MSVPLHRISNSWGAVQGLFLRLTFKIQKTAMSKIVKGSALIDDYGGVTFTPYDSNPAENTPWTVLARDLNGKLQCSKNKINLVITFNRPATVQDAIALLQRQSASLVSELVKVSVQRRYEKVAQK